MKKLTKGFEASTARVNINVDGQTYEAANLRKGGILHNNIILVGQEDRWLEVDCVKLCISNDLVTFKNLVVTGEITPSNIGLYKEEYEPPKQYGLKHEDFVKLEGLFPAYPYYMISHLFNHLTKSGRRSCYDDLRDFMKQVASSGKSIHDWIRDSENGAVKFIEKVKPGENIVLECLLTDKEFCSLMYKIHESENGYHYEGTFKFGGETQVFGIKHFSDTIKKSERNCLHHALNNLKQAITTDESPEKYYQLFKTIQNKFKIINMNEKTKIRESQLSELGLMFNPTEDSYTGYGFTVTGNSIENDSDEGFQNILDLIESTVGHTVPEGTFNVPSVPAQSETTAPKAPQDGGSTDVRIKELIAAGLKYDGERSFKLTTKTAYFDVDILDIQTYSDRKWTGLMIDISKMLKGESTETPTEAPRAPIAPEEKTETPLVPGISETSPAKKPVSIATIGNLGPDRIEELQGLKDKQLKIVESHPFVKITDAKTLKQAKTSKAALLKASTGTEKIEGDATKYLNTFKKMLKDFITPLAKITRDAHDKQAKEIQDYENAEVLRLAAEQKARLEKNKQRTDSLFAVPMTFNGSAYNIGTLYIMPSQIVDATDEEFTVLLMQAQAIKTALDKQVEAEKTKETELEAARKKIAELTGTPYVAPNGEIVPPPVAAPPAPVTVEQAAEMIDKVIPPATNEVPAPPPSAPVASETVSPAPTSGLGYPYQLNYVMPSEENVWLNKLDMENLQAIENPNYLKARAYFIRGTKDVAQSIHDILNAPTQEGVKKSDLIAKICSVILSR